MIRVLVVDDHPAVRAGLVNLLRLEPGLVPLPAVPSAAAALEQSGRERPDVVVLDYNLPDCDGLVLCCDLKALPDPPRVVVYSAFARPGLTPVAAVAGADAILDKGTPPELLFETVRRVVGGIAEPLTAPPEAIQRLVSELDPADVSLFGLAFNGVPAAEIASLERAELSETRSRLRALVSRLGRSEAAVVSADG
jgi:DNA-binding NarL/FixJ family response regulator